MFDAAMESRTSAATALNVSSSRSHFVLYLEFETKSPTMRSASKGSLCLVDLAGSEDPHKSSALESGPSSRRGSQVSGRGSQASGRVSQASGRGSQASGRRSQAEDAERQATRDRRLREGIAINQSLRVLRQAIPKIRNPTGAKGKPTLEGADEESATLAKLLGPCLGRESMVLMFVMINLGIDSLAETKATLESGKEIAEVKLSPKKGSTSEGTGPGGGGGVAGPSSPRKPVDIKGSKNPRLRS
ncbi:P-loop containing nucleoside triphosphate hydrolase protein [Xylaria cf. heliscus]|nr:P-loop containing nucleoside triphosphate hydrolase protein [Xylaria cf. heliscus]